MPHYADGTEAKVGDVVCGTGYNVKHQISGVVANIVPNSEACNIQVVHTIAMKYHNSDGSVSHSLPLQSIEYGETKAFIKVG